MLEKRDDNFRRVAGKWVSVCLMMFCLTFLTSINYFLYPSDNISVCESFEMNPEETENNFPPGGPTEEKGATSSTLTLAEEMLHETHPEVNFEASNFYYLHHIAETEKLEIFHPEILLPPPKFHS
jgi:hypothetical protein